MNEKKCKNCGFLECKTANYCGRCGVTFQTSRGKSLKSEELSLIQTVLLSVITSAIVTFIIWLMSW